MLCPLGLATQNDQMQHLHNIHSIKLHFTVIFISFRQESDQPVLPILYRDMYE